MSDGIVSFARDFTIDFFGSLLPGILMVAGIYVGIIYPNTIYYGYDIKASSLFSVASQDRPLPGQAPPPT